MREDRTPFVVLDANRQYWDRQRGPRVSRVVFRNDLTQKDALTLCTTTEGRVDIVTQVSPEDASKVKGSLYADLVNVNGNKVVAGVFNGFLTDIDFNDKRLRLALNLAVNRDKLVQEGFFGYADVVPALTPPWAFDFPGELTPREYEPGQARQLLVEAGWPAGRALELAAPKEFEHAAFVVGSQLQASLQINVNVTVFSKEEEVKWRRIAAEKKLVPSWDILLATTTALFLEGTPAFFHREFFGADGAFRTGPENPEFDALYKRMAAQTDQVKLLEGAKEIDRYTFNEALGLFLCSPQDLYAVNKQVKFRPYRTTFELADTEVTPLHWSRR
ncbi:ABC transporter substrate-binding protein [Bacillus sp. DJP31]|uniref:ABC transporter substrate-binding protein n=1 Tax=Bacillus sp. DJP31 TaxID=3409789 RepID=UPI003BB63AC7